LKGKLNSEKQSAFLQDLQAYFEICREIDRQFSDMGNLAFAPMDDITTVTYRQSINTITTTEIRIVTAALKNHFSQEVVLDPLAVGEAEQEMQEELIDRLLVHRDILSEQKQVVAYRDGGKVFVYNR
jgi:hypothetical protein